uniref:Cyclic nucleotide-binding domain-containing protein n=1 Tax=Guillardia theta TaxID=55529 RepID=A0A7S4H8S1_GUITH|mmetsp:Transcript_1062/g.3299  ORF Transcript_1062/g.3299 Transcript_1062/m.3299 type:complete len:394 (+) Transcript_1062:121-1302(+)
MDRKSSLNEGSFGDQDLDAEIWNGDGQLIKPWHPMHVPAPTPPDEAGRLKVLEELGIMDTPADSEFDSFALLAQRAFRTLSAAINFIDAERQWSKATIGYDVHVIDRDISICAHTILKEHERESTKGVLVVLDTSKDERFKFNDLCTAGVNQIKFYAGCPINIFRNGVAWPVGTICVFDSEPRTSFDLDQCAMLQTLSKAITNHMSIPSGQGGQDLKSALEDAEDRAVALKKCMAFTIRKVDDAAIRMMAEKLKPVTIQEGQYLTRKGSPGDPMYFIVSGSLVCTLNDKELERLTKGQCVGELSFINIAKMLSSGIPRKEALHRCRRAADVVATDKSELLALSFEDAWPLLRKIPNLWYTLQDIAHQRLIRVSRVSPKSSFSTSTSACRALQL